jgi:hypothetical protein
VDDAAEVCEPIGSGHAPERGGWRARRHSGRAMSGHGRILGGVAKVDPSMSREHRGSVEPAVSAEEIDDHLRRVPDRQHLVDQGLAALSGQSDPAQGCRQEASAVRLREADRRSR